MSRTLWSLPCFPTKCDAFDLLLQKCSHALQAKQIHAQILLLHRHHLHHPSAFLCARLISVYSRFGLARDAHAVFNGAAAALHHQHSTLLWNSILRATLGHDGDDRHRRRHEQVLLLYLRMRALGAIPDGFTFPLVIRACAAAACSSSHRLSSWVHGHAVTMGFRSHLHVANELIVMYGNAGKMDLARKVFDAMPLRNVVTWNTLISGYSLNGECGVARDVFRRMESDGLEPNPVTWTALLSAHARCQQHELVLSLFDEMRARVRVATAEAVAVGLSVCPYACGGAGALSKGKAIHCYAILCGFEGYMFVRNSLICLYGKMGYREDAERVFWESEFRGLVSWNALISSYAAGSLCNEAYEIFSKMQRIGEVTPNVVTWTAVISGFLLAGMLEQSLHLFRQMQKAGIEPNSVTITTLLSACAELSALPLGKEVHAHILRSSMYQSLLVGNGLLNMYMKSGSLSDGHRVFDQIGEDKDLISWNSMIAGYGMHGLCGDALAVFSDMVRASCEPDEVTFVSLLSACSHAGRVSEGRELFERMVSEFNISPSMEHYSCMVDLLGRAGMLGEAIEFIRKMPMKPNPCVWGALLNSCRIYGDSAVAEHIVSSVLGFESEATGNFMLLSNIYATCEKWEDSARVRVLTKAKGLKKNPGQSWIQIKNEFYAFSAGGSTLQSGMEHIYTILEYLYQEMENENLGVEDMEMIQNAVGKGQEAVSWC